MATYLIGYDLTDKAEDAYTELEQAIKSLGSTWWHHLDSTWIVVTELSATEVRDKLTPHLKSNDKILVVKSGREAAWRGFNDRGSTWLKDHL